MKNVEASARTPAKMPQKTQTAAIDLDHEPKTGAMKFFSKQFGKNDREQPADALLTTNNR